MSGAMDDRAARQRVEDDVRRIRSETARTGELDNGRPAWFALPDGIRARLAELEDAVRENAGHQRNIEKEYPTMTEQQGFYASVAAVRECRAELAREILRAWDAR